VEEHIAPTVRRTEDPGRFLVVGQAARDLVLQTEKLPDAGKSGAVSDRIERLGGKGANIAVGLRQLNPDATTALVAVLGTDAAGHLAHREADESGLNVDHVARRGRTALLIDLVSGYGERRLFEDVPSDALLTVDDIHDAAGAFRDAGIVVLQLQQPPDALLAAAHLARNAGARIVLDGAVEGDARDALLAAATVVRADAVEASLLTGIDIESEDDAARAASELLARGPALIALSVRGKGDLLVWRGGSHFYPHGKARVIDPTGAGDAFVAGLATGLQRHDRPEEIGQLATDAASTTVQRLGGHPHLANLRGRDHDPLRPRSERSGE